MRTKACFSLMILLSICFAMPQEVSAQLCNSKAHDWVTTHESELPRTYEDFSGFPLNYRRAIYSALDASERSHLWQEQFQKVLERNDLTNLQREVVLEAIQLASPEMFASLKDRKDPNRKGNRQLLLDFERRARAAFSNEEAGGLFARIGPADQEFGVMRPLNPTLEKGLEKAVGCGCSDASDYCSSAFNCRSGGCTLIRDECGTLWTYDCDGQCHSNSLTPNTQ